MEAAAEHTLDETTRSPFVRRVGTEPGLTVVALFVAAILVLGVARSNMMTAVILAGLLSVGAMLVSDEEPLSIRCAGVLGTVHLLGALALAA